MQAQAWQTRSAISQLAGLRKPARVLHTLAAHIVCQQTKLASASQYVSRRLLVILRSEYRVYVIVEADLLSLLHLQLDSDYVPKTSDDGCVHRVRVLVMVTTLSLA